MLYYGICLNPLEDALEGELVRWRKKKISNEGFQEGVVVNCCSSPGYKTIMLLIFDVSIII